MAKKGRASEAEVARRVETVAQWLVQGYSRGDVVKGCAREWSVRPGTADLYGNRARALLTISARSRREELVGLATERYQDLYRKAYEGEDWKLCMQIQGRVEKLFGLDKQYSIADLERLIRLERELTGLPSMVIGVEHSDVEEEEDDGIRDEVKTNPGGALLRLA